ncbi:MAG: hypothetical protein IIA07_00945 [Proteobacteria bacterium]|nr:hypothetical protein [Pseudomonadota bacterium]
MTEEMIPITMFAGLTIVFCLFFWFRFRMRNDLQLTIRTAIDKGQQLTPEIIDGLGRPKPQKDRDLRLAVIWLALAAALTVFGFAIPDDGDEVQRVFMGIAALPFFLGIAFFVMWRFTERKS